MDVEQQKPSILIIDDVPAVSSTLASLAEHVGFQPVCTTSAPEFWKLLERLNPAVVVTDLQMPDFDGIEILSGLADRGCRAGVVICSGYDVKLLEVAEELARRRGLNVLGRLEKPVRLRALSRLLAPIQSDWQPTADDLRRALADGEILPYWQPIVDARQGTVVGAESLVRWERPGGRLAMPAVILPLARASGLMPELQRHMLQASANQYVEWRRQGMRIPIAVNVLPSDLTDQQFLDRLWVLASAQDIPPSDLTLELTEDEWMDLESDVVDMIARIRLRGFRLAIDDFGTGHSSLLRLRRLPVNAIKIDRSFVRQMGASAEAGTIVRTVVGLAQNLGLGVIAEGVETAAALRSLLNWGCDAMQGYLLSRPVRADRVAKIAASGFLPLSGRTVETSSGQQD